MRSSASRQTTRPASSSSPAWVQRRSAPGPTSRTSSRSARAWTCRRARSASPGRIVEAQEALDIGLVNELVPGGNHLQRALEYAEGLAAFPQQTMLADRKAAIEGGGRSLEEGLKLEAESAMPTREVAWRGASR